MPALYLQRRFELSGRRGRKAKRRREALAEKIHALREGLEKRAFLKKTIKKTKMTKKTIKQTQRTLPVRCVRKTLETQSEYERRTLYTRHLQEDAEELRTGVGRSVSRNELLKRLKVLESTLVKRKAAKLG